MGLQGVVYVGGACVEGVSIGNRGLLHRVVNVDLEICPGTTIRSAPGVQGSLIAFHSISWKRIPLRAVYLRYATNELSAGNSL
jgi:hypothetical protein